MTNTNTNPIQNINLIETLINAIKTRTSGDIDKTCKTIQMLPVMEQYYLIKGFKIVKPLEFSQLFNISPKIARNICEILLKELYYFGPESNEETAYKGMGNIDIYVQAI